METTHDKTRNRLYHPLRARLDTRKILKSSLYENKNKISKALLPYLSYLIKKYSFNLKFRNSLSFQLLTQIF